MDGININFGYMAFYLVTRCILPYGLAIFFHELAHVWAWKTETGARPAATLENGQILIGDLEKWCKLPTEAKKRILFYGVAAGYLVLAPYFSLISNHSVLDTLAGVLVFGS